MTCKPRFDETFATSTLGSSALLFLTERKPDSSRYKKHCNNELVEKTWETYFQLENAEFHAESWEQSLVKTTVEQEGQKSEATTLF